MCGINGVYNLRGVENPNAVIQKMNERTTHRGPDFTGDYSDEAIILGHNRLSIIDLSNNANQPLFSNDQNLVLVFNGEIYNYLKLKEILKDDYEFKTSSDSEVLIAAYQKWGKGCVHKLEGMFAFAIWDKSQKTLFVVRDRLGIKPLYYFDNNQNFAFSSELRGLLDLPFIDRKVNEESLVDYLRYGTVHAPNTIVEGVKMLEAGYYIWLSEDEYQVEKYWDVNTFINRKAENQSYEEVKKEVKERLSKAVKNRMQSDVPYGAFLSGGIDSSAVVALMSEASDKPVKTFSISFAEEEYSEAKYARQIADKFKTEHTEIKLSPMDFLKDLPVAMDAMDHPSADGLNSYIVSKVTKEKGVTMALSGLGGDELFAGYDIFHRAVNLLDKKWSYSFPLVLRKLAGSTLKLFKPSIASDKITEIITQKYLELPFYYPINRQILTDDIVKKVMNKVVLPENRVFEIGVTNLDVETAGFKAPFLSKVAYLEMNTYMQNVLLRDVDQMSMASALEVRVPFLDHQLVEYIHGVPDEYKFPYSPKKLLVDSLGDLLPPEIVNREKMGFVFPWQNWLKKELKAFCEEQLEWLKTQPSFNEIAIDEVWSLFLAGNYKITWSRVWHLVVLAYWLKKNEIAA
ncbi:MAG: asparagine synthase (glutamine-hydrolyzing) [Flavobacteriales bacterium]|jgi:asparagine synthase (glutamine-hydrolysing)|nr:asparagine synthase (glutamine-hydrolyzing) [Flavobacteriales bacterium]